MERQQPVPAVCTGDGNGQEATTEPLTTPASGEMEVLRMKRRKSYTGKTFFCPRCQYSCTQKGHLTVHLRTHTGEKPYQCQSCSQAFACVSTLIGHLRVHTREKPYQCPLCEKRYSQKTPLTYHLRKHSNFKPYICRHCGKAFDRNSSLGLHLKKLHQSQPYYCTFCRSEFARKFQLRTHQCPAISELARQTVKSEEYSSTTELNGAQQVTTSEGEEKRFSCEHVKCKRTLSLRSHSGQHRCLFDNDNLQQSVVLKTEYTYITSKCDSKAETIKALFISEVKPSKSMLKRQLKRSSVTEVEDTKTNIFDYEEKVNLAELHKQQQQQSKSHTLLPATDSSQSSAEMSTSSFRNNCFQSAEIFQAINCSPPVEQLNSCHQMTSQTNLAAFHQGCNIPLTTGGQQQQQQHQPQTVASCPRQQCHSLQQSLKPDPFEDEDADMKQVIETLVQYLPLGDSADSAPQWIPETVPLCPIADSSQPAGPVARQFKEDTFFAPSSPSTTTALPSFATLAPMAIAAGAGVCHLLD